MPHDDCSKEQDKAWGFYALWELLSHRFDELEAKLNHQLHAIMSKISDFVAKQTAHNTAVDAALDQVNTAVTGITGDISTLNDLITQLQNSQGAVTPEDQALLDQLEAAGTALETKAAALATAAQAADALTPPSAPPTP